MLSNIQYAPFGAAQAWNWNMTGASDNNASAGPQPYARSFDTSGRLTRYPLATTLGNTLRDLSYDPASRITAYTHYQAAVGASSGIALPNLDQQFAYDANGRLTQATVANPTAVTTWAYSYDANGNRTSVAINGNTPGAYTIDAASNRVTAISTPPVSLSYDAAGNTLSDGTYSLGYNPRGRLASVAVNGNQTTYSHDNAGNRVRKFSNSGANSTQLFVYDLQGHLLGEYDQTGAPIREYIWLDDQPVAVFTPDPAAGSNAQNAPPLVFYIYADHLNTPRAVVDTTGNLRWSWVDEPFGTTAANSNPQGQGTFIFNLRFPGQFYDAESGMHYNVNRDYVPGVGRYAQSDPIGLAGGQDSTYAYVDGNPTNLVDPEGLGPLNRLILEPGPGGGPPPSGGLPVPRWNPRPGEFKPSYAANPAHDPRSPKFNPKKTPEPDDCTAVYSRAVPDREKDPRHWWGKSSDDLYYRFHNSNDGTAHFSGSFSPYNKEVPTYVRERLRNQ